MSYPQKWLRREDSHLHERIQSPSSCWLDDTAKDGQGDRTCTCMISVPSGVAAYLAPHPVKLAAGARFALAPSAFRERGTTGYSTRQCEVASCPLNDAAFRA